jgi:hypothetical protein
MLPCPLSLREGVRVRGFVPGPTGRGSYAPSF